MRTGLKIGALALLAASGAASAGFSPLVRAQASARAERAGLSLEIGAVRPGLGRLWLRDVRAQLRDAPSLNIRLDAVEVRVSAGLVVTEVTTHGGEISVTGAPSTVMAELRAWRAKRRASSDGEVDASARGAPHLRAAGLHLLWRADPGRTVEAWGLALDRSSGSREELTVDLARARWGKSAVELAGGGVSLVNVEGQRWLERVTADHVAATLELGATALGDALTRAGPTSKEVPAGSAAPRPGALSGSPDGSEASARERGPRLRAALARAALAVSGTLPASGAVDLDGLELRLRHAGQTLNFGPGRLHVVRDQERVVASLTPGSAEQKAPLTLKLELPLGERPVGLAVEGGPVSLASLGVKDGDLGLTQLTRSQLTARLGLELAADGRTLDFAGQARLDGLSVEKRWLSAERVAGLDLAWRGHGNLALDGARLVLDESELGVGKVRLTAKGQLERGEGWKRISLTGGIPLASCDDLLESSPAGLTPLLAGMRASGTFSLDGRLELDTRRPDDMVTRWTVANGCRITAVPASVSPRRFHEPWTRVVTGADRQPLTITSGPGTPTWVPRFAISKHMETALMICEDAGFRRHHGFDEEAIRNSIRENVKAGRFLRGASTLSMQLAKNLYLSREKTLSRKLEEAVLTLLLEQELTKDEILELYLNVVEFGPGIYGIGPAARYYFNTSAAGLSLGQSLYLASILPNPRRQHFGAGGAVSPGWSAYLRKLMQLAHRIHRISDDELAAGLEEQVTFGVPARFTSVPGSDGNEDLEPGEPPSPSDDLGIGDR